MVSASLRVRPAGRWARGNAKGKLDAMFFCFFSVFFIFALSSVVSGRDVIFPIFYVRGAIKRWCEVIGTSRMSLKIS